MSASGGGTSRPKYTIPGGLLLGEGQLPEWAGGNMDAVRGQLGYMGDMPGSQGDFPIEGLFAGLKGLPEAANAGGSIMRSMTPQALQSGMGAAYGAQGAGMGGLEGIQNMLGLQGNFLNTANQFGQGINQAQRQFEGAYGAANQTLQNVMNPTAYNPIFQNSWENQMLPNLRASYAARGLHGGGSAIQGESEGMRDLTNDFAQRQFQEQIQAQQGLGNLASAGGSLGVAAGALPGEVLNQFMRANQAGIAGAQGVGQMAGLPLQTLGQGGEIWQMGMDMPMNMASNMYGLTRTPMESFGSFINAVPSLGGKNKGFLTSLFS